MLHISCYTLGVKKRSQNSKIYTREISPGKWYVTVTYWEKGTRQQKRCGVAPSKTLAEKQGQKFLDALGKNVTPPAPVKKADNLESLLLLWQEWLQEKPIDARGYKATTKRTYVTNVDAIINHTSRSILGTRWKDFRKPQCREFSRCLSSASNKSKKLSNNRIASLMAQINNERHGLWSYLELQGYFDDADRVSDYSSFCQVFQKLKPSRKIGTQADRWIDFQTFKKVELSKYWKTANRQWLLAFQLMYFAGLRLGEVRALTWSDIGLKRKLVRVNKSISYRGADLKEYRSNKELHSPKTETSDRVIPMSSLLVSRIDHYIRKIDKKIYSDDRVVVGRSGGYFSDHAAEKALSEAMQTVNLEPISPRDLRRSFAHFVCDYMQMPYDEAKLMMGHTDTKLLEEVYAKRQKKKITSNLQNFVEEFDEYRIQEKFGIKRKTRKIIKRKNK